MTKDEFLKKWEGKLTTLKYTKNGEKWINTIALADPRIACQFDDGWLDLVDRLMTDLFQLGWDGEIHQTKEKFGGLRFYVGKATEEMYNLIDKAEQDSHTICEKCGKPGSLDGRGWHKTLCEKHKVVRYAR